MSRYCMVRDDDGHSYIIPFDKRKEWANYLDACMYYWGDQNYDGNPPVEPSWATSLGCAPSMVTFSEWRIENAN